MLKMGGKASRDGKVVEIMVIGLSHANLDRLRAGQPIMCKISDFGVSGDADIIIFAGETERTMAREFHEMIGPETQVSISPRVRDG